VQTAIVDDIMSLSTPEECELVGDSMRRIVSHLLDRQSGDAE
jgi:hypothetical protein